MQPFERSGFESYQQYTFPNIVNLCVVRGVCPCLCVHCPVGITPKKERPAKFGESYISLSLFKKITRQISGFPHSTLRIHGVGEPMLWNQLADALEFTWKNKVRTWLFTSLVIDDTGLLEKLAQFCDIIEISLNSCVEEDYRKTKGIDAFSRVKQNIEFLKNIISRENFSTRMIVSRVESDDKSYDSTFIDYWKNTGLVADAFVRSYHDYNTLLENKFAGKSEEIVSCLVHWSRFNIDCDGSVVLCFNELFKGKQAHPSLILGNLSDQTIEEIWHGEKLDRVRKAQMEKDYSLVNFTDQLPCINCFSCQSMKSKSKPTSEHQVRMLTGEQHG